MSTLTPMELSETFYIHNKSRKRTKTVKLHVHLNAIGLRIRRELDQNAPVSAQQSHNKAHTEQLLPIADIVGTRCGELQKRQRRHVLNSCSRQLADDQVHVGSEHKRSGMSCRCRESPITGIAEDAEVANQDALNNNNGLTRGSSAHDISAYLYVYAYIKRENPLRRDRTVRILRFRTYGSFAENLKMAQNWNEAIHHNRRLATMGQSLIENGTPKAMDQRELLIFLNPKSGSGKGRELFQQQVAPLLQEAEMPFDLQITRHANFAREFMRLKPQLLQQYRGVIVASGDGLFFEVLNGIMERDDWYNICHNLPIGIIPCGSGNGLAKSIAHLYNEPYEPKPILHATLNCVNGSTDVLDVVRVEVAGANGKQTVHYSFLSIGWGLIADIDIGSERLRSIGAQRFTVWSIHRLINLRTYKGKVYYLPWRREHVEQRRSNGVVPEPQAAGLEQMPDQTPVSAPENSSKFYDVPDYVYDGPGGEEFTDVISLDNSSTNQRKHTDSWRSAASQQTAFYSTMGEARESVCSQPSIASVWGLTNAGADFDNEVAVDVPASEATPKYSVMPTIPSLNLPLPMDTWRCIEDEFIMVHTANSSHLASDCYFAPASKLNDGIIYLVIIRAGVSRPQLLQFLLNMSSGTHLPAQDNEYIQVLPVSAFRIEPAPDSGIGNGSIMAVDGERVEYGPIQGEMFPGLIKVMIPKSNKE